jgi:ABC-type branched-subunit amino acid transport system permease subunit
MAAFGGAMTAMMVFRPEGLLPAKRKAQEVEMERKTANIP